MKALRNILFSAVFLLTTPAWATSFSQIIVFGDSLSDTGNIFQTLNLPAPPYFQGRISNGPVWVEQLAANLGLGPVVNSLAGGTNYAFSGALTGEDGELFGGLLTIPSLASQRDEYLAGNIVDPNALYVVWGAGNNVRTITSGNSATDIAGIVASLADQGATNFIVPNLPDIGATPESLAGLAPGCTDSGGTPLPGVDCSALMNTLTTTHNAALAAELGALDPSLNIVLFDVFSIFNSLISDPGAFGFSNTNAPCWDGNNFGQGDQCANPDEYVFWDGIHPTAAAHALLGQMAHAQVVPIPAAVWLFGSAILGLVGLRKRAA